MSNGAKKKEVVVNIQKEQKVLKYGINPVLKHKIKYDRDDFVTTIDWFMLDSDKNVINCSFYEHIDFFKILDNFIIGREFIDEYMVSTVFLSTDQAVNISGKDHKPLIFETLIFSKDSRGNEIYLERYHTYQEAQEGHQRAVEWVKNGCKENQE